MCELDSFPLLQGESMSHVIEVKDNFPDRASKCVGGEACLYEVYARLENTQVPIMEPSHSKW